MSNKSTALIVVVILVVLAGLGYVIAKKDTNAKENATASEVNATEASDIKTVNNDDKPKLDDPVVARVDGTEIRRSEVLAFAKNLPPQMQAAAPEQLYPLLLEQVVAGKIIDEKAAKVSGLTSDSDYKTRMVEAETQIKRGVFLERELDKQMSDDRLQKAYDQFKTQQAKVEEVKARHILVDSEAEAQDVIKKLDGGAKFEDLAKQYSKDPSNKASGGDLGYFAKDSMVKEFADAAFSMEKGSYSKAPVKTQFGYHVIMVEDKRDRPVPTLEQVKPQLEAAVKRDMLNGMVEAWRKDAKVEVFDINGNPVKTPDASSFPTTPAPAESSTSAPASPEPEKSE